MSRGISGEMRVCSWYGVVLVGLDNEQFELLMKMSRLSYRAE